MPPKRPRARVAAPGPPVTMARPRFRVRSSVAVFPALTSSLSLSTSWRVISHTLRRPISGAMCRAIRPLSFKRVLEVLGTPDFVSTRPASAEARYSWHSSSTVNPACRSARLATVGFDPSPGLAQRLQGFSPRHFGGEGRPVLAEGNEHLTAANPGFDNVGLASLGRYPVAKSLDGRVPDHVALRRGLGCFNALERDPYRRSSPRSAG